MAELALLTWTFLWLSLLCVGGGIAAYKVARTHRGVLNGVQLALEQILDQLGSGTGAVETGDI